MENSQNLEASDAFRYTLEEKKVSATTTLQLNDDTIKRTDSEHYLGDFLSTDHKRDSHIKEHYNRDIGIVNPILNILKEISFGYYYLEHALLLRNAK